MICEINLKIGSQQIERRVQDADVRFNADEDDLRASLGAEAVDDARRRAGAERELVGPMRHALRVVPRPHTPRVRIRTQHADHPRIMARADGSPERAPRAAAIVASRGGVGRDVCGDAPGARRRQSPDGVAGVPHGPRRPVGARPAAAHHRGCVGARRQGRHAHAGRARRSRGVGRRTGQARSQLARRARRRGCRGALESARPAGLRAVARWPRPAAAQR